jgi:hypothetical protein
MSIIEEKGMNGIKELSRKMKRDRRDRPKTVLKIKKSVYGIPDDGQAFSMLVQALHTKKCGLKQSEMDPCIYFKIKVDNKATKKVQGYLIVITWVDDCRYFGTDDLVKTYERVITKNCKCTLEGEAKEFVSVQIKHDLEAKTIKLTHEDESDREIQSVPTFWTQRTSCSLVACGREEPWGTYGGGNGGS